VQKLSTTNCVFARQKVATNLEEVLSMLLQAFDKALLQIRAYTHTLVNNHSLKLCNKDLRQRGATKKLTASKTGWRATVQAQRGNKEKKAVCSLRVAKLLKTVYSSSWEAISEPRSVTCHMGSHSVTCHLTEVNAPRQACTQFTHTRGMEGWVDLSGWLYTEMVRLCRDSHPSRYWPSPAYGNYVNRQGSDTRVRTQKTGGFFGYTHLKNPPPKNTSTLT